MIGFDSGVFLMKTLVKGGSFFGSLNLCSGGLAYLVWLSPWVGWVFFFSFGGTAGVFWAEAWW